MTFFILIANADIGSGAEKAKTIKPFELQVSAGGSQKTGNTESSEARLSLDGAYTKANFITEFTGFYQYKEVDSYTDQNLMELKVKELLNTNSHWLPFLTYEFSWDEIKGVEYDHNLGAGTKYIVFSEGGGKLSFSTAALYQVYKNKDFDEEENIAFALEPRYSWKRDQTQFVAMASYQADPGDTDNFKYSYNFKLTYFLNSVLGISAEFESRYRNIVSADSEKLDTTTLFSVTLAY
ncbi:hypothetical protein MNBD_NITROSPINAE02-1647 [hydrothermal vent metagenome]|uniref:DUF481 domain-containing protein n=1 Tax=hydrothermal vent metagenome TaxID=652676 RepID=A0A3B1CPQ7_9ZZZZ